MRIYVNQAGYRPCDKKIIMVADEASDMKKGADEKIDSLIVCDSNGNRIETEKAEYFGFDRDSGDDVWRIDVSGITKEGIYVVSMDGSDSVSFVVSESIYDDINRLLCKALYYQRCGTRLDAKYAGVFKRACCHTAPAFYLDDFNQINPIEVSGGWHDAGDYGRYTTAAATALAHILYAYIFFPHSFEYPLDIPESGNGIPDILNECMYELRWLFKMQRDDGGVCHKLTSMRHANFVMPHDDRSQMILFPPSTMATADFAAVMALASRVYRNYDADFSKKAETAAKIAWNWMEKHQYYIGFENPIRCNTGEYADLDDRDERMWAAAELYQLTGEEKYIKLVDSLSKEKIDLTAMGWADVAGFAGWAMMHKYIMAGKTDCMPEPENRFKDAFIEKTAQIEQMYENSGYHAAMEFEDYGWGSNMVLMNRAMIAATTYMIEPAQKWKDIVTEQMGYLLGANATGYSYITAVGANSCHNPHNRVTVADHINITIPGFVVGGPNKEPVDEKAQWLIDKKTSPMKCYADVWECYSLNEITIYWNSPAIFLTAFLTNKI